MDPSQRHHLARPAKPLLELIIIVFFMIIVFLLSAKYDFFERFVIISRKYEAFNLDEVAILAAILALGLMIFAFRRWRDQAKEVELRQQAEERILESEKKYRFLVENSIEGIAVLQEDKILFTNKKCEELTGYPQNELLDQPFLELVYPDDREKAMESHVKRLSGQDPPQGLQIRLLNRNKEVVWLGVYGSLITWQGKPATLNFLNDITMRKKTEEALERTEQSYQSLFNNISDWINTHDLEGRLIDVNDSAARALGYTKNELIGMSMSELIPEKHRQAFFEDYLKTIKAKGHNSGIVQYHGKSGEKFFIEYRNTLVQDEEGKPYISCVGRDITGKFIQEKQVKDLEKQLRQAQKMEAVGTLAGGIAHDFNNILQAIIGYSDLVSSTKTLNKTSQRYLTQVENAAHRATELVRQLLMFSRQMEPALAPLDINKRVIGAVKLLERIIPKMINMKTRLDSGLKMIKGDATQIEQVLLNLGTNARDAMPNGGEIIIETSNVFLDEAYCRHHLEVSPGPYVLLKVTDSGQGMDQYTLDHIFDPFYTTKNVGEGTGLGLATTYGIIKGHNGHIICHSQPGQGSSFSIFLPALSLTREDQSKQETLADEEDDVPGGTETILVVDDEWTIINIVLEGFHNHGYKVLTAGSGERALEIYREQGKTIDLVIMDVGMPGMGGLACIKELMKIDPDIKLVLASGYAPEDGIEEALQAGALAFIPKPYHLTEMLKATREILDKR